MPLLDSVLPQAHKPRALVAIFASVTVAGLLMIWGTHVMEQYGIALFVLSPIMIGLLPAVLYAQGRTISMGRSMALAFISLGVLVLGLFLMAVEGVLCLVMAAPLSLLLTGIGGAIGYSLATKAPRHGPAAMTLLLVAIPSTTVLEQTQAQHPMQEVTTSVVIDAELQEVWDIVIAFPDLDEPTEWLFRAGIAYPISAEIDGLGVGAIRRCNFSTGSFVEPITAWEEPTLLAFDVAVNPAPMNELSFWDINAPHLHDYFVSKKGQFKLSTLPDGRTRLEGTTWYQHHIKPDFYWSLWSEFIIHRIHQRVLEHIKVNAEARALSPSAHTSLTPVQDLGSFH